MLVLSGELLQPIDVMCITAPEGIQGIGKAWEQLESKLPTLKGRKFYGVYHYPNGPYRACVATRPDDNPTALGLETWTIPGGKYRRRKLPDWEQNKDKIGAIFEEMSRESTADASRPSIEFYRSQAELILYLPIL